MNNEDVRRLFVFVRSQRHLVASLSPPNVMQTKAIFFLKKNAQIKLTRDNLGMKNITHIF